MAEHEMSPVLTEEQLRAMPVAELRNEATRRLICFDQKASKDQLVDILKAK